MRRFSFFRILLLFHRVRRLPRFHNIASIIVLKKHIIPPLLCFTLTRELWGCLKAFVFISSQQYCLPGEETRRGRRSGIPTMSSEPAQLSVLKDVGTPPFSQTRCGLPTKPAMRLFCKNMWCGTRCRSASSYRLLLASFLEALF